MGRILTAVVVAVAAIVCVYLAGKDSPAVDHQAVDNAISAANHGDQSKIQALFTDAEHEMRGQEPLAPAATGITPDEWGMDDGAGVGPRVAGTPCLAAEAHEWASPVGGGQYALWCPPPAFVWVPVR